MRGTIQRLLSSEPEAPQALLPALAAESGIVALTADLAFYAKVLNAAASVRWRADWARTLLRAIALCKTKRAPIVIYDNNLPGMHWQTAFDSLRMTAVSPRLLLAAPAIDEDLWKSVLARQGYDVIERSATPDELRRILRFALLSLPALA